MTLWFYGRITMLDIIAENRTKSIGSVSIDCLKS